tara:strand:+ start:8879 stop:9103 length:225 start_codon:yes stop_codon:yes gene_type:complete
MLLYVLCELSFATSCILQHLFDAALLEMVEVLRVSWYSRSQTGNKPGNIYDAESYGVFPGRPFGMGMSHHSYYM